MSKVRLAFTPECDFQSKQAFAFANVSFPIPKDFYDRRLYALFVGSAGYSIAANIDFFLNARLVYRMPYNFSTPALGQSVFPPGGPATGNNSQQNSLQVNFGAVAYVVHAWTLTLAADTMKVTIVTHSAPGSQLQFSAIHSQHLW